MNCDLHDIQNDIQKLAKQQNQIQVQAMQAQQLFQAQQIANILNQQYSSQQNLPGIYHPIQQQQYGSTPHIPVKPPTPHHQLINEQGKYMNQQIFPKENVNVNINIDDQYAVSTPPMQYLNQEKQRNIAKYVQDTNSFRDQFETVQQQSQFFLHQDSPQTPPQHPPRRTWSQKAPIEMSSWSQQAQQHQNHNQIQQQQQQQPQQQSWKSSSSSASQSEKGFILHQNGKGSHESQAHRLFPLSHTSNPSGPPPEEFMAPQSISFIGDEEDGNEDEADNYNHSRAMDGLEISLGKLNITSGSRTYRIPSPTTKHHPGLAVNSFQSIESQNDENEKGFYISFDNEQPKRPKPPLRTKKSPKKKSLEEINIHETPKSIPFERSVTDIQPPMRNSAKKSSENSIIVKNSSPLNNEFRSPIEHREKAILIADEQNNDERVS